MKALIFDVDGTLAETEEAHRRAFNETFAEEGIGWHWDAATYGRLLGVAGGKERMRSWRETAGGPDDAEISRFHALKTERYGAILAEGGLSLRPGVREMIAEARAAGLRTAVATTTSRANVAALVACCWRAPLREVFDVVAAGDEVAAKKPAPDVYLLALDRLGLAAQEALAFEDSAIGLRAARAAGLATVVTPSAYTRGEAFAGAAALRESLSHCLPLESFLRALSA